MFGQSSAEMEDDEEAAVGVVLQLASHIFDPQPRRSHKRRHGVDRDRVAGLSLLMKDYFVDESQRTYSNEKFPRRFRMRRELFLKLVDSAVEFSPFFHQRKDAVGKDGFTAIQKVTSAMRQLAYGGAPDQLDEYLCMSEQTSFEALKQ